MVKITTINILERPRALMVLVLTRPWLAGLTAFVVIVAVGGAWLFQFLSSAAVEVQVPPQGASTAFPEKIDTSILNDPRFSRLRSFGKRPAPQPPVPGQVRDIFLAPPWAPK